MSALAIFLLYQPMNFQQWILVAALGSIVVLPFWIAALFGWTTGGMQLAWQGEIEQLSACILHGSQTLIFLWVLCCFIFLYQLMDSRLFSIHLNTSKLSLEVPKKMQRPINRLSIGPIKLQT